MNERIDKVYRAVFLDHDDFSVMVLPELGGRIQYATNLTNGYDFLPKRLLLSLNLLALQRLEFLEAGKASPYIKISRCRYYPVSGGFLNFPLLGYSSIFAGNLLEIFRLPDRDTKIRFSLKGWFLHGFEGNFFKLYGNYQ